MGEGGHGFNPDRPSFIRSKRPATSTGVLLRTTGQPPVPSTRMPPVVRQTVTFPAGTILRPECSATHEILAAQGAEAVWVTSACRRPRA